MKFCWRCEYSMSLLSGLEWPEDDRDIVCGECSSSVIQELREALVDAIKRPKGVIPDSAEDFLESKDFD